MKNILEKTKQLLAPRLLSLDAKITKLIPNPKLKKVVYIGVGSLFGFMFLIIFLGLLLSPIKNQPTEAINPPKIVQPTSAPDEPIVLTETQKKILELETKIKNLRFPEGDLNIPIIESNISI